MNITRNPDYAGPFWAWLKANAIRTGDANQRLAWMIDDDPEEPSHRTSSAPGYAFATWCRKSPHWPADGPTPLRFGSVHGGTAAIAKAGGPSETLRVRIDPRVGDAIRKAVAASPEISSKSEFARIALEAALDSTTGLAETERLRGWLRHLLNVPVGRQVPGIAKALNGDAAPAGGAG